MTELLGCPFCGKTNTPAVFEFDGEPYVPGYEIRCDASGFDGDPGRGCGATSGWGETVAEAAEAWNRRASLPEAPAVPVGVKALEWVFGEGNYEGQQVWHAGDPWLFWIVKNTNSEHYVWCETLNMDGFVPASPVRGSFDTLEAAKAAAQADFEARIRSALQSSQPVKAAAVDGPRVRQIIFDALDLSEELRIECTADVVNALTEAGVLASQNAVEGEAVAMDDAQIRQWIDACNHEPAKETLRHYLRLRASPRPAAAAGVREALAEFLCSEFDFDLNPIVGASWPEHPSDDGYRGGGYVRIQPSDVQARARDNAKRILTFLEQRASDAALSLAAKREQPR